MEHRGRQLNRLLAYQNPTFSVESSTSWGVMVMPQESTTVHLNDSTMMLHISQATLMRVNQRSNKKARSGLLCKVGELPQILICSLSMQLIETCLLDLAFKGPCKVVFSVEGPQPIDLAGYFLHYPRPAHAIVSQIDASDGGAVVSTSAASHLLNDDQRWRTRDVIGDLSKDMRLGSSGKSLVSVGEISHEPVNSGGTLQQSESSSGRINEIPNHEVSVCNGHVKNVDENDIQNDGIAIERSAVGSKVDSQAKSFACNIKNMITTSVECGEIPKRTRPADKGVLVFELEHPDNAKEENQNGRHAEKIAVDGETQHCNLLVEGNRCQRENNEGSDNVEPAVDGMELKLAVGEEFDLEKAICNHGFFMTAPNKWNPSSRTFERPLRIASYMPSNSLIVSISQPTKPSSYILVRVHRVSSLPSSDQQLILEQVARMLRISSKDDNDMKIFHGIHAKAKKSGFGRLFRSPDLFEDIIKTILLCNTSWQRTLQMCQALCQLQPELQLGNFPSSKELASLNEEFLKEKCHLGYRAKTIIRVAQLVENGKLKLSELEGSQAVDTKSYKNLVKVKGIGPFTAANIIMCIGIYHKIPIDSETIAHMEQVHHRKHSKKTTMARIISLTYDKFAPYQCLAYWQERVEFYEKKVGENLSNLSPLRYGAVTSPHKKKINGDLAQNEVKGTGSPHCLCLLGTQHGAVNFHGRKRKACLSDLG